MGTWFDPIALVLVLVGIIWAVWGVIGLLKPSWMPPLSPKRRFIGLMVAWLISVALMASGSIGSYLATTPEQQALMAEQQEIREQERLVQRQAREEQRKRDANPEDYDAQALGFIDYDDQILARNFGFSLTEAEQWAAVREEKETQLEENARTADLRRAEQQRVSEENGKIAAEAAATEERRRGLHCLSEWDGSHRELARAVIDSLNNPRSFQHVATKIAPVEASGDHILVMEFRARKCPCSPRSVGCYP